MREFRVIGTASSVEKLNKVVQGKDRAYGDPLTPNFLYDEMKKSKWFATLEVSSSYYFVGKRLANGRIARSSAGCRGVPGMAPPGS
ncbi:hypothetical protein IMZ48_40985 [Candidatus Bathyarchaeota archaeon]|nr:hypothetical protein [Candidatus Bathyarchaeota archaeon]